MVDETTLKERHSRIVMHLAQKVKDYREEHQMTKARFARECGVSVGFLSRLERGEANPTLDMIDKLAEYMGVRGPELLFPY